MSLVAGVLIGANLGVLAALAVQAAARHPRPGVLPLPLEAPRPAPGHDLVRARAGRGGVVTGRVPGVVLRALPGALDGPAPSKVERPATVRR